MNRIKLLAISTIAGVMILGSTIVFASTPSADTSDTSADQTSVSAELAPGPARRGGGGAGHNLRK